MENKKFEWRTEDETEWTVVDDELYESPKTLRDAAMCIIDTWYVPADDQRHKIFVRDVETKNEEMFEFSLSIVLKFY